MLINETYLILCTEYLVSLSTVAQSQPYNLSQARTQKIVMTHPTGLSGYSQASTAGTPTAKSVVAPKQKIIMTSQPTVSAGSVPTQGGR